MKLAQLLAITKDHHAELPSGAISINLHWSVNDDCDYWHLSDYAVSSRSGQMLVMVPKSVQPLRKRDIRDGENIDSIYNRGVNELQRHRQIVARIRKDIPALGHRDTMSLIMDLESVPELDTVKLLEADKFNFAHDICGIVRHMDRSTWPGKLTGYFVPRCSKKGAA